MSVLKKITLFDNVTTTGSSVPYINDSDTLLVETSGSYSGFSCVIQGLVQNTWSCISGVYMQNYNQTVAIANSGVYMYPITGFLQVRAVMNSISGSVTVVASVV